MDQRRHRLCFADGRPVRGGPASRSTPAAKPPAAAPSGAAVADNNYILGIGDVIDVAVLGQTYSAGGRIDADGKIQMQYLGAVKVSDQTAAQVQDQVGKALEAAGYYIHPTVRVNVSSASPAAM